jgi:hypothetical protein
MKPFVKVSFSEAEFRVMVNHYLEQLKTTNESPVGGDINDFFSLVKQAISAREDSEGVPADKRMFFVEEDPPRPLETPAITFYLKARVCGRFDQGSAGQGHIKEVVAHQRAIIEHPEHPSEKLVSMGKFYDNWVTFNVYAATNKVAMERLIWFESIMDSFSWYFRLHGFRVIEEGVGNRERVKVDELTLTTYPLSYYVRSENVYHFGTQELKQLLVNVEVDR